MFAKRMSRMGESATLKAMEIANRLKAQGVDIISLNVGEPDYDTPAHIRRAAIKALDEGYTHYTPSWGFMDLREAIAEKCNEENGIPCEAENVMVTTCKFALFATIMSMIEKGDEVIIPEPSWGSYVDMVDLAGGRVRHTGLKGKDKFRVRPSAIAEQITDSTKLLILNSPSNPTGGMIRRKDMKGIVELAEDHDFYIISDEVYEYIVHEGEHISPASLPGTFDRTITINGFSKAYAMTGWRMGYLVAPRELIKVIIKMQQQAMTCVSAFSQRACITALKSRQSKRAIRKMVKEFTKRRKVVVEGLNAISGINCPKSPGTFYAFPSYDQKRYNMDAEEMATYLLERGHVSITAGTAFGPSGEGCFRLSYANSMKNIREGLKRIAEALGDLRY